MKTIRSATLIPAICLLLSACGANEVDPFERAEILYAKGDFAAANIELMVAVNDRPNESDIHLLRARVFARLGDGVAAEGAVSQARSLGADANILATLAVEAALLQKDVVKAARLIAAAEGEFEKPADEARLTGEKMLLERDFGGATQQFEQALAIDAKDSRVHIGLGHVRMLTGNYIKAAESAQAAIALSPDLIGAHILAGRVAMFQGQHPKSIEHFDTALTIDSNNAVPIFGKAAAFGEMGKAAEMQQWVSRGLKIVPADPYGLYLQAKLFARKGDFKRAHVLMEQADEGLADDAVAMTFAGEVAIKMGYTAKAIGRFERAIALAPEINHLQFLLAKAQLTNNEPDSALITLRHFDKFNPQPAEVAELKTEIAKVGGV
jgi:tetratricopeptide (TPR) repeat protein